MKYYTDLKMSDIIDNKKFWKNVKPIFGNKIKGNKTIALEEENEVITDDGKLAQTFNEYFVNIVPSLGITSFHENNDNVNNDNIDNIIRKFEGHPKKVSKSDDLPTKVIKEFGTFLLNSIQKSSTTALNSALSLKT